MKIEELKKRFTSGNSVPVERAYLTKDEFNRLLRVVEAAKQASKSFPTDSDMREAGWDDVEIDAACNDIEAFESALRDLEQS